MSGNNTWDISVENGGKVNLIGVPNGATVSLLKKDGHIAAGANVVVNNKPANDRTVLAPGAVVQTAPPGGKQGQ